ncbi:MAG TPA: penicillin-binding transpeptidase domain-containing protein [Solirubrobacteraceae bacterium]|jgi:penicillin-binding protein 2|nr:penicillin-binding transpeptidase domain-containing protein [Solirubrobacteraceae bacterium]
MTERPRVLEELGNELDRAAQHVFTDKRGRLGARSLGAVVAAVAAAAAVAVAVVAILLIGHRHPRSVAPATPRPGLAAPRGEILDGHGRLLVGSRAAIDVEVVPDHLPVPLPRHLSDLATPPVANQAVYDRLAAALGISTRRRACPVGRYRWRLTEVACDVAGAVYRLGGYENATVASDVAPALARTLAGTLPGVTAATVYLTTYPHYDLGAQTLGTVGAITAAELTRPQFQGVPPNAVVGQTGLEYFYDRYLRARDTLRTSIDLGLERVGQTSLATSIARNAPRGAGAFLAMDPQNGQVLAMGSLPTYDPGIFTRPISRSRYARLIGPASGGPLNNRATDGLYATGSTFKPITALAALESGTWRMADTYDDTGQYCFSAGGMCLPNAGNVANGSLDLVSAIRVSDDVFFYNLGAKLNVDPVAHPLGGPLQQWARLLGIGQPTGIDLPYEASGTLPDPKWRGAMSQAEVQYENKHHTACCTLARPDPWTVGDNVNLAVGQGDLLVTPLQLAVAYAAIANGGTVVRPHIGAEVLSGAGGQVVQKLDPPPARHINISPAYLAAIRRGLRLSASAPGGTSSPVMARFPQPVYGATGSATRANAPDQAWYVGYVPATATSKPIVVVVTVEKGGFGAVAAAPVARQILSQWFLGGPGPYVAGTSRTR